MGETGATAERRRRRSRTWLLLLITGSWVLTGLYIGSCGTMVGLFAPASLLLVLYLLVLLPIAAVGWLVLAAVSLHQAIAGRRVARVRLAAVVLVPLLICAGWLALHSDLLFALRVRAAEGDLLALVADARSSEVPLPGRRAGTFAIVGAWTFGDAVFIQGGRSPDGERGLVYSPGRPPPEVDLGWVVHQSTGQVFGDWWTYSLSDE